MVHQKNNYQNFESNLLNYMKLTNVVQVLRITLEDFRIVAACVPTSTATATTNMLWSHVITNIDCHLVDWIKISFFVIMVYIVHIHTPLRKRSRPLNI